MRKIISIVAVIAIMYYLYDKPSLSAISNGLGLVVFLSELPALLSN